MTLQKFPDVFHISLKYGPMLSNTILKNHFMSSYSCVYYFFAGCFNIIKAKAIGKIKYENLLYLSNIFKYSSITDICDNVIFFKECCKLMENELIPLEILNFENWISNLQKFGIDLSPMEFVDSNNDITNTFLTLGYDRQRINTLISANLEKSSFKSIIGGSHCNIIYFHILVNVFEKIYKLIGHHIAQLVLCPTSIETTIKNIKIIIQFIKKEMANILWMGFYWYYFIFMD